MIWHVFYILQTWGKNSGAKHLCSKILVDFLLLSFRVENVKGEVFNQILQILVLTGKDFWFSVLMHQVPPRVGHLVI